jgi:Na+/H+ antiporter NhaA
MTCLTSTFAFGGRPAGPLFADEQVVAVGQLEHSLAHSSSAVCLLVFFLVMDASVKNEVLYSHQLSSAYNKDVEMSAGKEGLIVPSPIL